MKNIAGKRRVALQASLLATILLAAGALLLTLFPAHSDRQPPFVLAAGPQLGGPYGLGGPSSLGGARAYVEAVEALSGIKIQVAGATTFSDALGLLAQQEVDGLAFALPGTTALLPRATVISPVFYAGDSVLLTRSSSPVRALSSLEGKRVTVIGNGEYHGYLAAHHPAIEVIPLPAAADMVAAVDSGTVDAALGMDAILIPLARRGNSTTLAVHPASDGPSVRIRVASHPARAAEMDRAHQAFRSLPLDTQQDLVGRWMDALYRSPPTLHAVLSFYRTPIIVLVLSILGAAFVIIQAYRNARATAALQASTARMLTLVNHEVRNGVASVISAIDLIESTVPTPAAAPVIASARAATSSLHHTLANALEFMFLDRHSHAPVEWQPGAATVLAGCLSASRPVAAAKGTALLFDLDQPVLEHASCDTRALRHIASNLISNAVKFCDAGTVSVRLRFEAGVGERGRMVLRVSDTGEGISAEDLNDIFGAFSTTRDGRQRGGTGLGLSLCRRIATAQGGQITVRSQPGVGSTFTATLPAQRRTEPAPALPGHLSDHNDRPARALVIEDQPLIADVISHRLRERGFEVRCATSRHEALQQLAQAGPFDLITLDDALPDASGLETIEAIRALERTRAWLGARVVSISASPDVTRPLRYRAAGIAATLCKPIDWPAFDVATHCTAMNPARALRPAAATPLDVLAVYRTQIPQDVAALREAIVAHEWRRALGMSHRIRGAASMVGDAATLVTLDQIDGCLKHHAINGDPGAADLDETDRLLAQMDPGT